MAVSDQDLRNKAKFANESRWGEVVGQLQVAADDPKSYLDAYDVAFIEAASPATVRALLDRVDAVERALAEAQQPRWTPLGYCPPWGHPLAAVCSCDDTDPLGRWLWFIYGRGDAYGYCATEAEAKAACEAAYRASKEASDGQT